MLATTLLLLTVTLLLTGHTALAEHRTCTWRPTNNAPDTMNYQQFCTATITNYLSNFTGAVYKCSAGGIGPQFTAIADWGLILLNLLELKTPCNSDGFGFDKGGHCMSPRWAACLGDAKSNNCLWYSADDDCTWPQFFFYPNLPDKITMWYDSHAAEATTHNVIKAVKRRLSTPNQHSIIQQLQAQIHALAARVIELERRRLDDLRHKIEDIERQGEQDWKLCSEIHDRLEAATCQADRDYLAECLEGPYQAWQKNTEDYREAIEAMMRQKEIVRAGERQQAGAAVQDHH